ncbi:MAG: AAA family ATPase [Methanosphaera sp.]|nr:AAA family ATPase [Methanosphaera sp.]
MYLDYVELENYRPYYGKQRINFGFDDNKNLTVILAENGSGKSTFVNGITWCLFGDEKHDDREKTEPLYNKIMAEELESEDFTSLNVNITIRFFDIINNEKKYFTVFRNEEYNNWGNSWEKSTQHLTIETFDGSVYKDDMAQYKIIGTIPEDMFQYFFFNGASLNNYFNENSKLNLKESIYNISQLDIISNVQKHIKGCLDKYNADYKKLSNNHEKNYNGLINKLNKQKSAKENEQKDNYKKIDEAINNIKMCDLELDNVDISEVDTLTSDRENIQKELKKSQSDYNEIYEKYEKKIIQLYPLVVLFDELSKAYEITHNAKQKKTAPPKVEIELLRDILSDGICICGTDINEHEECIKILTDRLNNTSNVTKDDFYEYYYLFQEKLKELYSIHDIDG